MRRLTILVIVLGALYGAYWFIGARAVEIGAQSAITQLQSSGWAVTTSGVSTRGFPSRFDTTVNDLSATPPSAAWRFEAPFVQALALSYRPNKLIVVLPNSKVLHLENQSLTILSDRLRASTGVAASTDLAFDGFTAEGNALQIQSDLGWDITIARLLSAMRPSSAGPTAYDVYAEIDDLTLGEALQRLVPQIPARIDIASADTTVTLDQPLDRTTFQGSQPARPTNLDVKDITVVWGDMQLRASGTLKIDTSGVPEGRITVRLAQWQQVVRVLAQAGILNPELLDTYLNMGAVLSAGSSALEVPITFDRGFLSVGPLPLGPAPRFF